MSKKNRFLRINDFVNIESVEVVEDNKKILDSHGLQPDGHSVIVKIAATHSGRVTKNNTFYLADKMKNSVSTWVKDYAKPILVHHDKKGADPIGRVLSARYVDTSDSIQGNLRNAICRDSRAETEFKNFVDGSMSFMRQLDFIQNNLSHTRVLDSSDYKGLGYIELTAMISDPEAAQKIRDGRYLTGSISATTDRAVCSVCKQDWIDEGKCDHDPGELYDGSKAFLVAGEFEYEEYSYVNDPADSLSQNLELVTDATSDNVEDSETRGVSDGIQLDDAIEVDSHAARQLLIQAHDALHNRYDFDVAITARRKKAVENGEVESEEPPMRDTRPPKGDVDLHEQLHREAKRAGLLGDIIPGAMDIYLTDDSIRVETAELPEYTEDSSKEKDNTMAVKDDTKNVETTEEEVKQQQEETPENSTAENKASQEDSTETNDKSEEQQDSSAQATDANAEEKPSDSSTSDEPAKFTKFTDNKSEDLNTSLDRVIQGEEIGEEDAEAVYELMVREMDSVAGSDEDKIKNLNDAKLSSEARKKLPDSAFCGPERSFPVNDCAHYTAAKRLIGRYDGPGDKGKISACIERKGKALGCSGATESNSDSVNQEEQEGNNVVSCEPCVDKDQTINELEEKLSGLRDHLKALREENALLYKDFAEMEDRVVEAELNTRKLKARYVADYKELSGESVEDKSKLVDELSSMDDNQLNSLVDSVDTKPLVDKINSGLSRNPSETVENPSTAVLEDGNNSSSNSDENELPEVIRENYEHLLDKSGARKARNYLVRQVQEGNLDPAWLERLS